MLSENTLFCFRYWLYSEYIITYVVVLLGFVCPLSHFYINTIGYATTNDPKTNECYNKRFYNERMLQRTILQRTILQRTNATTNDPTTNECYNERSYNERMLQRTVLINQIRMLQRTRRNTIARRSTRVCITCRAFPLWLERHSSSLVSFERFSYQFSSVICSFISDFFLNSAI